MRGRHIASYLITFGLVFIFFGVFLSKFDQIKAVYDSYFSPNKKDVTLDSVNDYYRDYDFLLVQNTKDFSPSSMQDIMNIYYTVINSGKTKFSFYCPDEYESCIDDIQTLANNQDLLSDINNYVHPFNSFSHIESIFDLSGKVTIQIVHNYSKEQISLINDKIDELYPLIVDNTKPLEENIKSIHDYIINNSKYDSARSDEGIITYKSDIAYGPLFEGYSICGGYSDVMELFLERLKVKSFKVSSDNHVWNGVYLNNNWYNLDLTWDDPVSPEGKDYLEHDYFLIDTKTLLNMEKTQHVFNQDVYKELKEQ